MPVKNQTVETCVPVDGYEENSAYKKKPFKAPGLLNVFSLKTPVPAVSAATYKTYASKMDVIRLFAMASIVWGHALFGWENQIFPSVGQHAVQTVLMQMGRLGSRFFL